MITGRVNARLEATVQLQIEDPTGHLHTIETIIDTGYSSDLTLRAAQISALGLRWRNHVFARLADGTCCGSTFTMPFFGGTAIQLLSEFERSIRIPSLEQAFWPGTSSRSRSSLAVSSPSSAFPNPLPSPSSPLS
jgi:hypothetical protein